VLRGGIPERWMVDTFVHLEGIPLMKSPILRRFRFAAMAAGLAVGSAVQVQAQHVPHTPEAQQYVAQHDYSCLEATGQGTIFDEVSAAPAGQFWASAEYLLWWMQSASTPPLLTTGPASDTLPGALGQPGTRTLFQGIDGGPRSGGRFTAGTWLNQDQSLGLEGSFFFLGNGDDSYTTRSSGEPGSQVISRPFFNPITGEQDRQIVSDPGWVGGSATINSSSTFLGASLNLVTNPCCEQPVCAPGSTPYGYTYGYVAGFRYLRLAEDLGIQEDLRYIDSAPIFAGDQIRVVDQFGTTNDFYGPQLGIRGEAFSGRWFVNGAGLLAIGVNHQTVDISGSSTFTPSGMPSVTQPGGFYALPTNMGSYSRNVFTVVPEINLNVGRQVTDSFRLFVGYTFLYVSNVVRPGDQIDTTVNTTQLPDYTGPGTLVGPARPAFSWRDTGMWVQGINVGAQFRF